MECPPNSSARFLGQLRRHPFQFHAAGDYPRLPLFVLKIRLSNRVLEHRFLGAQVLYPVYPFACETNPFPRVFLHLFATPCNNRRSMLKSYYAWP